MSTSDFQSFEDIMNSDTSLQWLIPGLLPAEGIAFLAGHPKHGKSFLAVDLALAVASGGKWLGKYQPEQGTVLYLDQEARIGSITGRIKLFANGRGIQGTSLPIKYKRQMNINLFSGKLDELKIAIAQYRPRLVIVDSFIRVYGAEDERSNTSTNTALQPLLHLANEYHCLFLILDHMTKPSQKWASSLRGAGDKMAIAEAIIEVRKKRKQITVSTSAIRDGEPEKPLTVQLIINERQGIGTLQPVGNYERPSTSDKTSRAEKFIDQLERDGVNSKRIKEASRSAGISSRATLQVFHQRKKEGRYICQTLASHGRGKPGVIYVKKPGLGVAA